MNSSGRLYNQLSQNSMKWDCGIVCLCFTLLIPVSVFSAEGKQSGVPDCKKVEILDIIGQIAFELKNEQPSINLASVDSLKRVIERTGRSLKEKLGNNTNSIQALDSIISVVYDKWKIGFDPDESNIMNIFPQAVIERKRGGCLGVALILICLGEKIGCPLYGVILPSHVFVRYDNGKIRRNIEPNKKGFCHEDEYYSRKYLVNEKGFYDMHNVTANELVAVMQFNIANDHMRRKSYKLAEKRYLKCVELFPEYAEAWGNLALAYDAAGETEKARHAFEKAFLIRPQMHNLALNRGYFELNHGNKDFALQAFEKGLEFYPENTMLLNAYYQLKSRLNGNEENN